MGLFEFCDLLAIFGEPSAVVASDGERPGIEHKIDDGILADV